MAKTNKTSLITDSSLRKKVRSAKKDAKVVELRAQLAREKLQKSAQLNQQS